MKKYLLRLIAVLLSLMIAAFFCPSFAVSVYASDEGSHGGGGHSSGLPDNFITDTGSINWEDEGVWGYILEYICAELGAIYSGDFEQVFKNDLVMKQYMIDHTYVANEGDDENPSYVITFDADLVSQIKQALKEYQQERYGYTIQPTVSVEEFSTYCTDGLVYRSLVNIIKDSGIAAVEPGSYSNDWYVLDLSAYTDGAAGFVYGSTHVSFSDIENGVPFYSYLFDFVTWHRIPLDMYWFTSFGRKPTEKPYSSLKELYDLGYCDEDSVDTDTYFKSVFYFTKGSGSYNPSRESCFWVVTPKGSDVLMFNSLESLKNYSIDKRSIFTTGKFYEDTGSLTVPLEDLSTSIDDLNGLLEKFRDTLPSDKSLTEDQLEDQLQKFLDEFFKRMNESGGSGGSGSGSGDGGGSSWSDGMIGDLFGYLEGIGEMLAEGFSALADELSVVIEQLDFISMEIEDMTQAQVEEKTDSFLSQLTSMFGEVADLVKTKFPFSMPWDIGNFFSVLGGDTVEVRAPDGGIRLVNAYAAVPAAYTDDAAVPAVISQEMSGSGAPVFRLPIVVASAGIDEEIVVDLSSFEYVHLISRGMLTVLYCLALVNLTFKIVDLGKGLGFKDD